MTQIRLTVLTGSHKGNQYCVRDPKETMVGRASDCDVRLYGDVRDLSISRHHCRLTIDPPNVYIDDLGSANGTFINGHRCMPAASGAPNSEPICAQDGDILTIGGTSLQINIIDDPPCDAGERTSINSVKSNDHRTQISASSSATMQCERLQNT